MSDDFTRKPAADDDATEILDLSELIDAHLDAQTPNEFADDVPTVIELRRICPGCGRDQVAMDETDQPPGSHAQAWRRVTGHGEGACRGNLTWFWCKASLEHRSTGALTILPRGEEGSMEVLFFPDRRIEARPVEVDRRRKDGR